MAEEIISAEHSYFALLLRCIRTRMITYKAYAHILRADAPCTRTNYKRSAPIIITAK